MGDSPVDINKNLDPLLFKALSEPNRIAILKQLVECCKPCSVTELNECCPIDISVVSRHLAVLRDAGIVEAKKKGKEVYYSICHLELVETLRSIADAIETCCSNDQSASNSSGCKTG
ncbi:winged helix-turn-helix transcriptional regulator [bacterium]|nr:winged helix-turn-helix transcriptional regulator [bacterium]